MYNSLLIAPNKPQVALAGKTTSYSPKLRGSPKSLQDANTPDIDLERDIIEPQVEAEIALGMEATELSSDKRFRVNISTILISALIFLAILSWFDFMQSAFYSWFLPETQIDLVPPSVKLWYAIFTTIIIFILIILVYYHSNTHIQ